MISLPLIPLSHRGRSYPTELVNENLRQIPFVQVVVIEGGGSSHARGKARRGRGSNSAKDTVPPCVYASHFPCKIKLNQAQNRRHRDMRLFFEFERIVVRGMHVNTRARRL